MTQQFDTTTQAKRALYLAWLACRGPQGMGILQDRPRATEEEVWQSAVLAGDYGGYPAKCARSAGGILRVSADYVFGRMLKLSMGISVEEVSFPGDTHWRRDYQGFCYKYQNGAALLAAAQLSLEDEAAGI